MKALNYDRFLPARTVLTWVSQKAILLGIASTMAACSGGTVAAVQNATLPTDPSFKIGQAFDNRKICNSVKWDTVKDTRDRAIVEYRCEFNGAAEYYQANREQQKKAIQDALPRSKDSYLAEIKGLQNDVDHDSKVTFSSGDVENANASIKMYTDQLAKTTDQGDIEQLKAQLARANYGLQLATQAAQESAAQFGQRVEEERARLAQLKDGQDATFATWDKNTAAQLEALDANPVTKVNELFQWTVSDDGTPELVYAGQEMTLSDDTVKDSNYGGGQTERAIQAIVDNSIATYGSYVSRM